ncbi:TPA: glycosyl hydrolase family 28-related protein, partial [Klebsiella pneumoniae]
MANIEKLGSSSPEVLLKNATNLDKLVNGRESESLPDRFGVLRKTWHGMEMIFSRFIDYITGRGEQAVAAIGWQELGNWAVGLVVDNRQQIVYYNGSWYKYLGELEHVIAGDSPENDGGVWSAANPTGKWSNIGDAALRSNLGSNELPGASLVSLVYGNVAGLLQGMTYPQAHGARGDGTHDDTDALYAAFKSSAETVHIPRGTYLITRKLKCLLTKNLNVVCAPGAVFKLADGVRDKMFVFVGADNRKYDFSWFGGELDGNWSGQGEETLNSNGTFKDLSRGMVVSLFDNVRLENIYAHDFRGHSINHAGNRKLHASNLRFNSHIAQAFPLGGSRGDGITGCSEIVDINGVYGFTTDDMVAVFAGILWVEGGTESDSEMVTDLRYLTSKSINIENVVAGKKLSDLDGATEVYTWNAVAISTQGGIPADKITI